MPKKISKLSRSPKSITRIVEGKTFVLNNSKTELHELNSTAAYIWFLLKNPLSKKQILKKICLEFDANPKEAEKDIDLLLTSWKKLGIVTIK